MNNCYSEVFYTSKISGLGLLNIYKHLNFQCIEKVAVKIHCGEHSGSYYLKPTLIAPLVKEINGTIIDANTPYDGNRCYTQNHYKLMNSHGFCNIAKCDIIDEDGSTEIHIPNGKRIITNFIGSHLLNYKSVIILNHFKGHKTAGYGGVIKDLSIGLASKEGKVWIHTAGQSLTNVNFSTNHNWFIESMADAAQSILSLDMQFVFISFLNNLSVDGDGCSTQREPEIPDIGIMASFDPVALEQACIDMIKLEAKRYGKLNCSLIKRITELNGEYLITASKNQKIKK